MFGHRSINSFSELNWDSFQDNIFKEIDEELLKCSDDYILNVNVEDFISYLTEKYKLEPLNILLETEEIDTPKEIRQDLSEVQPYSILTRCGTRYRNGYQIKISYSFTGSTVLFSVRPNPFTMTSYEINVEDSSKKVSFYIQIFSQDVEKFKREKFSAFNCAFTNLANINSCVVNYNSNLLRIIKQKFDVVKQKRLSKNNFFAAINVKKSSETPSTYGVPVIHKKEIKKPSVGSYKEYTIEPSLDMITYETIITEICQLGNSMERKPSLYQGKDEEGIRDFFVTMLETKFEGVTATGETFNHCGKTDILLKNAADGSNLFIAECKFWHGAKHFKESISQLFDRYLTWRDSKVALMVFVKGTNFTTAIESIHKNIVTHEYFVRKNKIRNETSSNYIFRLPQDANKEVFLEIIAFNFDKMID